MGTPAFANVTITCKNAKTVQDICDWIYTANHNKFTKNDKDFIGDYNIDILDSNDEILDLRVDSDRSQNLDWQLENLSKFCNTLDDVDEFSSSAWVMTDGPYWNRKDE